VVADEAGIWRVATTVEDNARKRRTAERRFKVIIICVGDVALRN
jgi:hypothetical protein